MAACPLAGSQTTQLPTGLPCTHSQQPQPITSLGEAPTGLWDTPPTPILDKTPPFHQEGERENKLWQVSNMHKILWLELHKKHKDKYIVTLFAMLLLFIYIFIYPSYVYLSEAQQAPCTLFRT